MLESTVNTQLYTTSRQTVVKVLPWRERSVFPEIKEPKRRQTQAFCRVFAAPRPGKSLARSRNDFCHRLLGRPGNGAVSLATAAAMELAFVLPKRPWPNWRSYLHNTNINTRFLADR